MKQFWKKNKLLIAILIFTIAITYNLYASSYTNTLDSHVQNVAEIETQPSEFLDVSDDNVPESIDKLIQKNDKKEAQKSEITNTDTSLPLDNAVENNTEEPLPTVEIDNNANVPISFLVPSLSLDVALNVKEGSSVYDAMLAMQKQTAFTFTGTNYGSLGYFVESIQGIKNDTRNGKFWIYYINGAKAQMGISQYIIQPHDIITWTYEDEEL